MFYFPGKYWHGALQFVWDAGGQLATSSGGKWTGAPESAQAQQRLAAWKDFVGKYSSAASRDVETTAPDSLLLAVVVGYPLVRLGVISTQDFGLRTLITGKTTSVGAADYTAILHDAQLVPILVRTVLFAATLVAGTVAIGLGAALVMVAVEGRLRAAMMVALLGAWAMPTVASTLVWQRRRVSAAGADRDAAVSASGADADHRHVGDLGLQRLQPDLDPDEGRPGRRHHHRRHLVLHQSLRLPVLRSGRGDRGVLGTAAGGTGRLVGATAGGGRTSFRSR